MLIASLLALGLAGPTGDVVGKYEADRSRIARHLQAVEAELRARDVSALSPVLQDHRRRNLERLRAYSAAGVFPHNDDFPGQRVPYFIDDDGVPCAVGFLVIDSGFADVAQEVHDTENNARLLAMTHPALPGWIAASGLTAAECAKIQPEYCECGDVYAPVCGVDGITYTNSCVAKTCAFVMIAHDGPCKGEDTTTGWPTPGTDGGPDMTGGASETGSSSGDPGSSGDAGSSSGAAESGGGGISTDSGESSGADSTSGATESSGGDTGTGDDETASHTDKSSGCQGCNLPGEGDAPLLGLFVVAALGRRRK